MVLYGRYLLQTVASFCVLILAVLLVLGPDAAAEDASAEARFGQFAYNLFSRDPAQRSQASRALLDAGSRATADVMRKLREALVEGISANSTECAAPDFALELMNVLAETLERDQKVVQVFRANDDCEFVRKLVELSLSRDKTTRGFSTIILANIIDNTTLPLVIDTVQEKTIAKNSLLNLLGVIRVKADYALSDNRLLIEAALRKVRQQQGSRIDPELTRAIEGVEQELRKNNRKETAKEMFGKDYCASRGG